MMGGCLFICIFIIFCPSSFIVYAPHFPRNSTSPYYQLFHLLQNKRHFFLLQAGLQQIHTNCYSPQAEAVRSFTYFRLNEKVFRVENWNNFVPFVRKMSTDLQNSLKSFNHFIYSSYQTQYFLLSLCLFVCMCVTKGQL